MPLGLEITADIFGSALSISLIGAASLSKQSLTEDS